MSTSLTTPRGTPDGTAPPVNNGLNNLRSGASTPDSSGGSSNSTNPGVLPGLGGMMSTAISNAGNIANNTNPAAQAPGVGNQLSNAVTGAVNTAGNMANSANTANANTQSGVNPYNPTFNPSFTPNVNWSYNNGGFGATNNEQVNSSSFADQGTANTLAQALGGKVVQGPGTSTSAGMNLIQLPNGTFLNAGDAANMSKVYGGIDSPNFIQAMNAAGRTASQATNGLTNLQQSYVQGPNNADPTGANAQAYTAVQSLYGGNPNLVNGGTSYGANNPNPALANALGSLLGTNGTSNGGGNSFNPALMGMNPSFYGQSTTTPLNETSNTGTNSPQNTNSINPQILQLLQNLLSGGGQSNTSALSGVKLGQPTQSY